MKGGWFDGQGIVGWTQLEHCSQWLCVQGGLVICLGLSW